MAARTSAAATGVAAPRLGAMILVCLAAACGGGSMPSQPQPDFTLSVTPSETYAVVGNTTAPVGISVAPQNGFTGTVTITLQGLPPGVGVSPSPPFQLAAAATQFVVLAVPTSATLGMSPVAVVATVGALSHRAQLTLSTHQGSVRPATGTSVGTVDDALCTPRARFESKS